MEEHTQTLSRVKRAQDREKVLRYSIRKYGFGAASVAIAALYLFMGRGAVYAAETTPTGNNEPTTAETANMEAEGTSEAGEDEGEEESAEELAKIQAAYSAGIEAIRAAKDEQLKLFKDASEEDRKAATAYFEELTKAAEKALEGLYYNYASAEDITRFATESVKKINSAIDDLNAAAEKENESDENKTEESNATEDANSSEKPKESTPETPAPKDEEAAEKPKSEQPGEANQPSGESSDANTGSEVGDDAVEEGEEPSEAVQKTLDGLKDKIDETKDTIIAATNEDKKASEEDKKAAVATVTEWAKKAYEALDAAYKEGADSEELASTANDLIEGLIKSFEKSGEEEPESSEFDRTEALKAIEEAKKAQEKAVDAREKELSETELTEAKGEIAKAAKEATEAIVAAQTKEEVDKIAKEQVEGIATINPVARDLHYVKFAEAVQEATDKINQAEGLNKSDKDAAIKKLEAYLKEKGTGLYSDENPAYGDTAEDAKKEEAKVLQKIEEYIAYVKAETEKVLATKETPKEEKPNKEEKPAAPTEDKLAKAKEAAKKEIAEELALVSANFESDESLSDNEKSEAKAGAKDVADQATQKVDEATTEEAVNEAKELGLTSLDNIYPIAIEKSEAEITKAADAKKAEITANKNLSEAEQKAAIAQVDAAVKKATEAFSKVPTDIEDEESADKAQEGVDNAKTAALKEIEAVKPIALDSLKAAVKKAQEDKLKEIQAATYLTAEERQKLESDVNTVATTTLKGFDEFAKKGVTEAALAEIKNQAVDTIQSIEVPVAPKEEKPAMVDRTVALKAIEDAKAEQLQKIAENEGISEEEANYANAEVEKEVAKAIKAVNDATTQDSVNKASQAGVANIQAINPVGKEFALDEITTDLADKKAEIAKATHLSDEEKKKIVAELDQAAELVKAGINTFPKYGNTDEAVANVDKQIKDLVDGFKAALGQAIPEAPKEDTPAPKENPKLAEFKAAVKAAQEKKLAMIKAADYLGADKQKELEENLNNLVSLILTSLEKTPVEELTDESKAGIVADIEGIEVPAKVEKPKVDTPTTETKPKEEPKTDKPATPSKPEDKPKADEPVAPSKPEEKPKSDEAVVPSKPEDKPKSDEAVVPSKPEDKPKSDEPVAPSKPEDKPSSETPSEPMKPMDKEQPATPKKRTLDDAATHTHVAGTEASLAGVDHLVVQKVKSAVLEGRDYDAFDIELRDANDKAIQPHGSVRVSLPARKAVEAVYYIDANNKLAVKEFTQADGMVSFDTDHFSVYALVYKAEKDAPSLMATNQDKSEKMEAKKDDKKELPNTGDKTPTVSFLVGLALALMGMLALKHKEN